MIVLLLIGLIFILYAILIGIITTGWFRLHEYKPLPGNPETRVSVIIAARNEEVSIGALLKDLVRQDYPSGLLEIIVVDDHSEDNTVQVVNQLKDSAPFLRLLELKSSGLTGKKSAIDYGIQFSTGILILTTDADCRLQGTWVSSIVSFYEMHHPKMILSPVRFSSEQSFFGKLQSLEFMSLGASTAGSARAGIPLMANGANFAYEKDAYVMCGGFAGNTGFPSGDDVFLLFRIKQLFGAKSICFLKSTRAMVSTKPSKNLKEFFHQRLRWVSKSRGYKDPPVIVSSLIVYFTNLAILTTLIYGFFSPNGLILALALYLIKMVIDFPVMAGIAGFFRSRKLLWLFPLLELLNILYTVLIGILGNLKSYEWKGRNIATKRNHDKQITGGETLKEPKT